MLCKLYKVQQATKKYKTIIQTLVAEKNIVTTLLYYYYYY